MDSNLERKFMYQITK